MSILKDALKIVDQSLTSSGVPLGRAGSITQSIIQEIANETRQEREERVKKNKAQQAMIKNKLDSVNPTASNTYTLLTNATNIIEDEYQKIEDNINNVLESVFVSATETIDEEAEPQVGDHLYVSRVGYTHHGLYIGDGKVIHYLMEKVKEDTLETFADGSKIRIRPESESPACYSSDEIVDRAYRRLHENNYNLLVNNCEHFVRWCRCNAFDKYL